MKLSPVPKISCISYTTALVPVHGGEYQRQVSETVVQILRAEFQLLILFQWEGEGLAQAGKANFCPVSSVPPEVTVLSNTPVELGEPNILICFIDKFSPPVINVTWLRNGNPVTTGVSETIFLPREDHLFRKFHYLPFLPSAEDVYDCKVEHWGLDEPLLKHWGMDHPSISFLL